MTNTVLVLPLQSQWWGNSPSSVTKVSYISAPKGTVRSRLTSLQILFWHHTYVDDQHSAGFASAKPVVGKFPIVGDKSVIHLRPLLSDASSSPGIVGPSPYRPCERLLLHCSPLGVVPNGFVSQRHNRVGNLFRLARQ